MSRDQYKHDSISVYGLRKETLNTFLQDIFGAQNFEVSESTGDEYNILTPRLLTADERQWLSPWRYSNPFPDSANESSTARVREVRQQRDASAATANDPPLHNHETTSASGSSPANHHSNEPYEDTYSSSPYKRDILINNDSVDGHDDELLRDHIIRAEAGSPSAQATRPEIPYLSAQGVLAWKTARKASRDVPLPHGWLRDSYLNQRDHVFLIDDSESMAPYWQEVKTVFEALSYIVKDMDPDGIELYFTISPQTARDKHTTKLVQLLDKKKLDGMTDISLRLKTLLDKYFVDNSQHYSSGANFLRNIRSARQSRPLNVYILTNGLWETDPDVESVLRRVTQKLLELNLPKSQIGLQFITFGENPVALRRLHHLDSHIEEGFDNLDTTPSRGNVWKMLLGAVNATFDDDLDMDKFQAINAALDTSGLQKSNTLSYSGGFRRGSSSFETNSNTIPTVSNDGRPSPEISRETPILEIPRNNLLLANQFSDSGHSSSSPWSSAIMSAANPISSHSSLEARIIRKAVTNNLQPVDNRSEDIDTGINSVPSDASDGFSLHDTIPTSLTLTRVREIAIKHIVREFTKDAELAVLFSDALARMPKDRFIRNNQRLLKSYFMNFRTQDKTVQERQAIRLLRGSEQRKSLAEETCIVLDTSQDLTKVERDALQEIDRLLEPAPDDAALLPDDDSDIQSHSGDDGDDTDESFTASLSNLERLVTFLMSGPPFLTYKSSLRDMLAKPKEIKIRSEEEALQINESSPQLVEKANLELGSNPDIEAESQAIAEMREGTPILDTTIDADQVINNSASRHCADHPEMIRPSKAAILDHENGYRILWRCRCNRMFEARLARQDRRLAEEFLQEMDWDESRDGPIRTQYTESYWIENLLWALAPNSLSNFIWGNTGNEHEARDLEDGHGPNLEQRSSAPVGSPTRNSQFVEDVNASAADLEVEDENDKVFICLVEKASSSGRPSNWRLTHAKMNRKSRSSAQLDIPAGSIVSENTLANPQGMDKALFQALREKLLRRQKSRSWRWLLPKMISAFEFWEFNLYHTAKLVIRVKKDKLPYESAPSDPAAENIDPTTTSEGMSSARAPPEPSGDLSIRVSVQRPTRGRSIDALRPHLIQEWEYFALPQPELIKYKMKLESAYLLHLFWHPEDALPKSPLWRGLPRKIKDKLRCKDEDPKIGWGFSVEYEWDWVTFTFLMVPFILIDFAIVAALSAHYQWPVATAFTVAMGPVTVIAFVNTMMSSITKQKGLSK